MGCLHPLRLILCGRCHHRIWSCTNCATRAVYNWSNIYCSAAGPNLAPHLSQPAYVKPVPLLLTLIVRRTCRLGVLIEVNCETDFVERGPNFKELVQVGAPLHAYQTSFICGWKQSPCQACVRSCPLHQLCMHVQGATVLLLASRPAQPLCIRRQAAAAGSKATVCHARAGTDQRLMWCPPRL